MHCRRSIRMYLVYVSCVAPELPAGNALNGERVINDN